MDFTVITNWFSSTWLAFYQAIITLLMDGIIFVCFGLETAVLSMLALIPACNCVQNGVSGIQSVFQSWASGNVNTSVGYSLKGIVYFLNLFDIQTAFNCVLFAYIIRFTIRRLPIIG